MRLTLTAEGMIAFDGVPLPLPPKERTVLGLLLRAYPDAVAKDAFAEAGWDDGEMSDESLARCVSGLRRTIPLDAGVSIRAVYGFGYRLEAQAASIVSGNIHPALAAIAAGAPEMAETALHARALLDSREEPAIEEAVSLLREITLRAPRYTPARILLAECLAWRAFTASAPADEPLTEAEEHLDVAERLTPRAAGLDAVIGAVLDLRWRFKDAALRHERALREHPDDPRSHFHHATHLQMIGRPVEAAAAMEGGCRLSPHAPGTAITLSHLALSAGDAGRAQDTAARAVERHRRNMSVASHGSAIRCLATGCDDPDAANVHAAALREYPFAAANLGVHFARRGEREKALRVVESQRAAGPHRAARLAPTLLALDLTDDALDCIEAAARARACFLPAVLSGPQYAPLRAHPRFRRIEAEARRG